MNCDQKHFPMLREYEKAKLNMYNQDITSENFNAALGNTASTFDGTKTVNSKLGPHNFMRSTAGKKLYSNEYVPPETINNLTKI